jgi:antitoxin CptB
MSIVYSMSSQTARLRWQCRRGMLELDAILQPFFEQKFNSLAAEEQQAFERLLSYPDPVLYSWLLGFENTSDPALGKIIDLIKLD